MISAHILFKCEVLNACLFFFFFFIIILSSPIPFSLTHFLYAKLYRKEHKVKKSVHVINLMTFGEWAP